MLTNPRRILNIRIATFSVNTRFGLTPYKICALTDRAPGGSVAPAFFILEPLHISETDRAKKLK